jgi:hypothetical protein
MQQPNCMRRTAALLLVLFLAMACRDAVLSSAGSHPAADSVLSLIRTKGVRAALDSMLRDPAVDERWSDSIATGDSVWLLVAKKLRPESDASTSESLDQSLARALPNAPERVLRLLAEAPFSQQWVCGLPFFEGTPDSAIENHKRRALAALKAIHRSDLSSVRDSCLRTLQNS